MKRILAVFATASILIFSAFANGDAAIGTGDAGTLRIGIILTTSGLGDNNFNDMAYDGLVMAENELGITFDYGEPETVSDYETQQRSFASAGIYDLIIAIGADQAEPLTSVATDFPDQSFTLIDGSIDGLSNVHSIVTKFQDQTFLTGVLAGLMTNRSDFPMINPKEKRIGIIRGLDLPVLRNATAGYMAGARYVDPDVEIFVGDVGSFNDPGKAKEMALSMYDKGADFIQLMAGGSGMGIINAAVEANAYAFEVGANQNANQPDHIPATAIRNVNDIIFNDVKNYLNGAWSSGKDVWGIKEGAVGYSTEGSMVSLPEDVVDIIEDIRMSLVAGEIVPPSEVDDVDAWIAENQYY